MGKHTDIPGAEIALTAIAALAGLDEEPRVSYTTKDWDDEKRGFVDVPEHYVTYLDCSDTFWWGTSDAEEVTEETFPILVDVIAALVPGYREAEKRRRGPEQEEADRLLKVAREEWEKDPDHDPKDSAAWRNSPEFKEAYSHQIWPHKFLPIGDLFAARVRKMRPQGAAYKVRYDESIWHLFNECGPEREVGNGNPREPGQ
jgi:hypothetical protein